MYGRHQITDNDLLKTVNQRLMPAGGSSQTRVTATVQGGTVTLTGTLQYAIQRSPIIKSVANIAGVRHVLDQLQLVERKIQQ